MADVDVPLFILPPEPEGVSVTLVFDAEQLAYLKDWNARDFPAERLVDFLTREAVKAALSSRLVALRSTHENAVDAAGMTDKSTIVTAHADRAAALIPGR